MEGSGGWSVVSGMSTTGWDVGLVVSTDSRVTPLDVDEVVDVTDASLSMFELLLRLSFPFPRNFVGILMMLDWC